jgi:hypothetical protein
MSDFQRATVRAGYAGLNGTGLTSGEKTSILTRLTALEGLTPPVNITDLGDVDLAGIATGDLLQFDGTNIVKYTPQPISVPFLIPFVLDGAGSAISTGVWYDSGLPVDFAATITGWYARQNGTSNSIVATVQHCPAGSNTWTAISGTEKPTLSAVGFNSDLTLTTWTVTTLSPFDSLRVSVDSATATEATISILCARDIGP